MPQSYDMGQRALLPLRRKACWGLFRPKNPTASAGFEPTNFGMLTARPPKPLEVYLVFSERNKVLSKWSRSFFNGRCVYFLWPFSFTQQPPVFGGLLFPRFLDHTQRRTTVGETPLDEWLAGRRYLYLTKHNILNKQTSVLRVEFEPAISAGERLQTYALDRAATGTGCYDR
jgi:hypothetical protein